MTWYELQQLINIERISVVGLCLTIALAFVAGVITPGPLMKREQKRADDCEARSVRAETKAAEYELRFWKMCEIARAAIVQSERAQRLMDEREQREQRAAPPQSDGPVKPDA